MTARMTPVLTQIDKVLREYFEKHKRMPTRKELAGLLNWKSHGPISRDLKRLEELGKLKIHPRGTIEAELL